MKKLKGANMDIDLFPNEKINWKQDKCPIGKKCAVKNVSLCKHFKGIEYPDIVLCDYKE